MAGMGLRRGLALVSVAVSVFVGAGASGAAVTSCTGPLGAVTISGNVSAGMGCNLTNTTVNGSVTVADGGSLVIELGSTGTISGNVTSTGRSVSIRGGTIQGSVTITGAQASVVQFTAVGGSVTITDAVRILELDVLDSTVGGNVTVSGSTTVPSDGRVVLAVAEDDVHGSVSIHDNDLAGSGSNGLRDSENTIGGTNQVYDNTVADGTDASGSISSDDNRVGGRASFQDNKETVLDVSSNTITGNLDCSGNVQAPTGSANTAGKKTGQCAGL